MRRKLTRAVRVGNLTLGGGNDSLIQSMLNTPSATEKAVSWVKSTEITLPLKI